MQVFLLVQKIQCILGKFRSKFAWIKTPGWSRDASGCSSINSPAPFTPPPPALPFFPPLSSALAQDRINIPLKLVSTAARSPCPPLSLLLFLVLYSQIHPLAFLFFCFQEGIAFAAGRDSFITLSQEFPLLHACEHSCSHTQERVVDTDAFDRPC